VSHPIFRPSFQSLSLVLLVLVLQVLLISPALGTEGRMVVIEGADYFGLDYETRKELDLEDCKAACLADARCQAFTYNTKARWCFLKSDYSDLRTFPGAVSGHIAEDGSTKPEAEAVRISELGFLKAGTIEEARALAERVRTQGPAAQGSLDAIVADAQAARRTGNPQRTAELFAGALKLAPESYGLWVQLADSLSAATPKDWKLQQ